MKIYDCITFFNELDLLEIRMETLNDFVDYFVINEATVTFQNKPKPLYYLDNKDRFKKFEHKIIHNIVDDTPITNGHWDNDAYHKNCTTRALVNCNDDDIILYSDTDEIPNGEILSDIIKNRYEPNKLIMLTFDCFTYFLDARVDQPWRGTRFCNWGYLKQYSIDLFRNYGGPYWTNHFDETVQIHREEYNTPVGWHYSWLGGEEKARLKLESFGHVEYNNDYIKNSLNHKITNLVDIINRPGWDPQKIKIDLTTSPKYLVNNFYKYKNHFCNEENITKVNRLESLLENRRMTLGPFESPENNLYGLLDFVKYYNLSDKIMVELGSFLGISTELFAIFSKHVTAVDLWGSDESYEGGECSRGDWHRVEQAARERLSKYDNAVLIKDSGDNIAKTIEDGSLDLVYIDANHSYDGVISDIITWWEKIKIGGIISGHDYNQTPGSSFTNTVKRAVDEMVIIKDMADFKVFGDTSWSGKKVK